LDALGTNLQRLFVENGIVFLSPFMILGAYRFRSQQLIRIMLSYLFLLLIVMSFVFPFAGSRGGFFHSGVAVMPILWALVPPGLETAIHWGAKVRGWDRKQAVRVLGTSVIAIVVLLTGAIFWTKAIGPDLHQPRWDSGFRTYVAVEAELSKLSPSSEVIAVNNPPGFRLATDRECVVIPNGSIKTLRDVVDRYRVSWVVLDVNRPAGLASLYHEPTSVPWLVHRATIHDPLGREIYLLKVMLD
jgi:hypothetical protein